MFIGSMLQYSLKCQSLVYAINDGCWRGWWCLLLNNFVVVMLPCNVSSCNIHLRFEGHGQIYDRKLFLLWCLFFTVGYITGGYDGRHIYNDVWSLAIDSLQWTKLEAKLPEPVYFHSSAITPVSFHSANWLMIISKW